MVDKKDQSDIEPDKGTVRLIGGSGGPSSDGKGRVEMFEDKKWGAICGTGWTEQSSDVACKQMGFKSGKALGGAGTYDACKDGGYCVSDDKDIHK